MAWKHMGLLAAILLVALSVIQVEAYTHDRNTCMMYSECGPNPEKENRTDLNCLDNDPSRSVGAGGDVLLEDMCPGMNDSNVCCDREQLQTLRPLLAAMQPVFGRCPACLQNILTMMCSIVCSPHQSLFTRPASVITFPDNSEGVLEFESYVDEYFANIAYDSCKNVQFPAANTPVMDVMCGGYLGDDCSPQRWLDFLGDIGNGFIPWSVDFYVVPPGSQVGNMEEGMVPLNESVYYCNEPVGEQLPCSCQDCERSCSALPTIPPTEASFMIGLMDGNSFIVLMVYVGVACLFVILLILRSWAKARKVADDEDHPLKQDAAVHPDDVSRLDKLNKLMDDKLREFFTWWGTGIARYPVLVLLIMVAVTVTLTCGILMITVVTDPVELWSGPQSRARLEKEYYDETFVPFYRTTLLYLRAPNERPEEYNTYNEGVKTFGPVVNLDILTQALDIQKAVENLVAYYDGIPVTLQDVCNKPLAPDVDNCLIQSVLQWYGNSYEQLNRVASEGNKTANYRDHFLYCMKSPLALEDNTPLRDMCVSAFGGPTYAYVALGGYPEDYYNEAELLAITILLDNKKDNDTWYQMVLAWESEFLDFMKTYENPNLTISYSAERSIEDELLRQSEADLVTITVSYVVIFAYIALALGEFSKMDRLLIDSKITLGLGGVLIVLSSVFASIGAYGYFGVETTLIVMEVVPFLILAIGADNIFIFVLDFQRDIRREGETREEQIGRVLGQVAPSMLLCGLSESVSFFLGALTEMPAVRIFALYSGLSVLINFVLQMTAFVALLSLDVRRQESGRFDIVCCIPPQHKDPVPKKLGLLQAFMKKYFAPFMMMKWVRPLTVLLFGGFAFTCIALTMKLPVGLDQTITMPKDSYVLDYLLTMGQYMKVGPPVYFVTTEGYYFPSQEGQNRVCGGAGCNSDSLTQQIYYASLISEKTYIAQSTSSWMDDYFDWLASTSCCRTYASSNGSDFCPSKVEFPPLCLACVSREDRYTRPDERSFSKHLPWFLDDVPNEICNKGGSAAYGQSVQFADDSETDIIATYFMTYHTPLVTSTDFITALKEARILGDSIKESMSKNYDVGEDFTVFPYSIFYVYYEQYLTLVDEAIVQLLIALIPIFVVSLLMLGFSLSAPFIIIITISMIVVDTMGIMYLWNIEFNAVSLVNLMMAVGISVEFVSHITRSFSVCTKGTKKQRAEYALATMGSSVLSGVAMTNLPGIIVLAFAKSQLFVVFYFRMFLTITLVATAHGLLFLPVVLSYIGPDTNKAYILEEQQKQRDAESQGHNGKAKEALEGRDHVYETPDDPPAYENKIELEESGSAGRDDDGENHSGSNGKVFQRQRSSVEVQTGVDDVDGDINTHL
ncbi:NPC intracellular cholesterol transporter 1-like [Diadema setosum]|uniref:NPC intracellular cholesterol transporter 1-like n=1 Tax=Diadema setosum TaxID=31175 RepID=UPI003B3A5325